MGRSEGCSWVSGIGWGYSCIRRRGWGWDSARAGSLPPLGTGDSVGRGLRSSRPGPNETFFMHPQPTLLNSFLQFSYILSTS